MNIYWNEKYQNIFHLVEIWEWNSQISSDAEKNPLIDSYHTILKAKSFRFAIAMICWSIGTLSLSIVLVAYVGAAPPFIGWLGIAASITIGFANVAKLVKPNFKVYDTMSSIFGMLAIVFELIIGGWLIFYSFIIP